jgi:hypothetical protein
MADADTAKPMDGVEPAAASSGAGLVAVTGDKKKPRFEIKKYNAVALWAWGACDYAPVLQRAACVFVRFY